jgi:hypothetical protein
MTLINSGGTTLTGGSVTISSIPQTYTNLYLIVTDFLPAVDAQDLCVRINGDSTSSRYRNGYFNVASTMQGGAVSFDESKLFFQINQSNGSSNSLVTAVFPDYTNTITYKTAIIHSVGNGGATNLCYTGQIGAYNQLTAISSLQFFVSSGNFTSGTFYLYGVK